MTISTKITGIQSAQDALRKELAKIQGDKYVTVGIHEGAQAVDDGSMTMAQLGATLHFGTNNGRIPARPWLDVGVASGNEKYANIIKRGFENDKSVDDILETVGVVAVGKVQSYMTDLRTPPNAPSTIKAKGSDNPLVDSGALRQSVTYAIQQGNIEEGIG
jgi:hypothetical protein